MAFPVVVSQTTSVTPISSTAHTITLPAGVGDLNLLLISFGDASITFVAPPAGWTLIVTSHTLGAPTFRAYYKARVPSDAGAELNLTTDDSSHMVAVAYCISGWDGVTAPEFTGQRQTAAPYETLAITPSWGAVQTLFITGVAIKRHATTDVADIPFAFDELTPYVQSDSSNVAGAIVVAKHSSTVVATIDPEEDYGAGSDWFIVTDAGTPVEVDRFVYLFTIAIRPLGGLVKYLKVLVSPEAQGDAGVAGVVFNEPSPGNIVGPKIGEFTGATFEAELESGQAVLKVPASDFVGTFLTTADTPVALLRNTSDTTGIIPCTIIEE